MIIELDGTTIKSEADFHKKLTSVLGITEYYGNNLNALWDLLSANAERPLELIWKNSKDSRDAMGIPYEQIVNILERAKEQDEKFGWDERFSYQLL
ncbi:barstar family protein [Pseudomonas sp. B21-040]|uniref:barstar family protein n=1 Tax=unclassified Pseudomonas TaxID=196821 RepID=UPI001CBE7015|nr:MULTISPECIES: barstar family protein [unclassified Pseudomonas]UVL42801.1 barstar family protein [Pseudomonas sp. B21-040]